MRFYSFIFILMAAAGFAACLERPKLETPLDTLKLYAKAIKKNDVDMMRNLLSEASVKMAEQEAASQNVEVEEVIKRETLFNESQTSLTFRNEKIDDDKATIEVENSFDSWDTIYFVKEKGVWRIDKQGVANQMMQQIDEQNKRLDDIINKP